MSSRNHLLLTFCSLTIQFRCGTSSDKAPVRYQSVFPCQSLKQVWGYNPHQGCFVHQKQNCFAEVNLHVE